jgi:SAM-dependent methyltransferase
VTTEGPNIDPATRERMTRSQWQEAVEAWHRREPIIAEWLGPATERMLDLAGLAIGDRVLDVAAGAGGGSIAAARRVGPAGSVLATDVAPKVLEDARQAARSAGLVNVVTHELEGEDLVGLQDGSFDFVMSRIGHAYGPDPLLGLREMHRVLRAGGRIATMAFAATEHNPLFSIPLSIIRRRAQLPQAAAGRPSPFGMCGAGELEEAYRSVGFDAIDVHEVDAPLRLSSAAECVRLERESFRGLRQMMVELSAPERSLVWAEIEETLAAFDGPEGFVGPCRLLIAVGVKQVPRPRLAERPPPRLAHDRWEHDDDG